MDVRRTLAPDPRSPREARRFVTSVLSDAGLEPLRDTVQLLVTELVTNALLHARTPLQVVCTVDNGALRVEVHDDSPAMPQERRYSEDSTTGRGLLLVDSQAEDWGVERREPGKAVWFTVSVDDESPSKGGLHGPGDGSGDARDRVEEP